MFCKQAISLAVNIKNHFERVLNQQMDRTVVIQVRLPCSMPNTSSDLRSVCSCLSNNENIHANRQATTRDPNKTHQTCDECGYKVQFIDYDDYLQTTRSTARNNRKRNYAASSDSRKKLRSEFQSINDNIPRSRTRVDMENYDEVYQPMQRMCEAVEFQQQQRYSQHQRLTRSSLASVATSQLDSTVGCDSALLLGLKKNCRVRSLSLETDEDSALRVSSSSSQLLHNQQHIQGQIQEQMQGQPQVQIQTGYESGSSSDRHSPNSSYFSYSFSAAHHEHSFAEGEHEATSEVGHVLDSYTAPLDTPLHIVTSPFLSGDLPNGAYLLTRCASPDASLDYSYPAAVQMMTGDETRTGDETAENMYYNTSASVAGRATTATSTPSAAAGAAASPGDGAALRDFLAACYRDCMYPSPIVLQGHGHGHHHGIHGQELGYVQGQGQGSSAHNETCSNNSSNDFTGPVVDFDRFSQVESAAWPLHHGSQAQGSISGPLPSPRAEGGSDDEAVTLGAAAANHSSSSGMSTSSTAFAYDELQQLLTHLLHETSSSGRD